MAECLLAVSCQLLVTVYSVGVQRRSLNCVHAHLWRGVYFVAIPEVMVVLLEILRTNCTHLMVQQENLPWLCVLEHQSLNPGVHRGARRKYACLRCAYVLNRDCDKRW